MNNLHNKNYHFFNGEKYIYSISDNKFFSYEKKLTEIDILTNLNRNSISLQNNKSQLKELTHSFWGDTHILNKLTINVTSACNLRCKYCFAGYGQYSGYTTGNMHKDIAIKCIMNIINAGVNEIKLVHFFGGEPLLACDTIDSICSFFQVLFNQGRIKSLPVYSLITNGTLYSNNIMKTVSRNNIHITLSIDGPSEINDLQRVYPNGNGSSNMICKNFTALKDYIKNIEATFTMNHIRAGFSVSSLQKYLSKEFCLDSSNIIVVPVSGDNDLTIDKDLYKKELEINNLNAEHFTLMYNVLKNNFCDLYCSAGYTSLCMMPNGDIFPCHLFALDQRYCLCNSTRKIEIDRVKKKLDEILNYSKNNNTECDECWIRNICHFCTASSILSDNNIHAMINPKSCESRRKLYERVLTEYLDMMGK